MLLEDFYVVVWNVASGLFVSVGRPVELGEVELEMADLLGDRMQDSHARVNDLWADAVRADLGDLVDRLPLSCQSVRCHARCIPRLTRGRVARRKCRLGLVG